MIAVRSTRIRRPGHKTGDLFHLASQRFARDANSTTGWGLRNLTDSRTTAPDRTGRAKPLPTGTVGRDHRPPPVGRGSARSAAVTRS